jgi:thioredoxin reductase
MIWRQGVVPGEKAVVVSEHSEGLRVADSLARAGVEIVALVSSTPIDAGAKGVAFPIIEGKPIRALGTSNVQKLRVLTSAGKKVTLACDLIVSAAPVAPTFELARQLGVRAGEMERGFAPEASSDGSTTIPGVFVAGELVEEKTAAETAARGAELGLRIAAELKR